MSEQNDHEKDNRKPDEKEAARSSITEEIYNRIPAEFKDGSASKKDAEENGAESDNKSNQKFPPGTENEKDADSPERFFDRGRPSMEDRPPREPGGPHFPSRPKGGPFASGGSPFSPLLIIAILGVGVIFFFSNWMSPKTTAVTWNGFCQELDTGNVESVNLRGNTVSGKFKELPISDDGAKTSVRDQLQEFLPEPIFREPGASDWTLKKIEPKKGEPYFDIIDKKTNKSTGIAIRQRFTCEIPPLAFADQNIDALIRSKVSNYTSTTPTDNTGYFMLFSILISVVLLIVFWRMMRRTNEQMMGGGLQGFTKSPMRRYDPNGKEISFADVAGLDNVKKELVEIVDFLKYPKKYLKMGARVPKGTLLFGPPGTGKTLLGRAVAGEAHVPFFSINGSEFMQMFVGVGASRVRELFNTAKENAPCILFIDEIDAVGRQRGTGVGGGHDEREQTLNQILSEMDGFVPTESVMVMAATNRPDVLDPALMRPGRFDRHITVDRPSLKGRKEIFDVYLKKIPKGADVDADRLARSTVGFTGADIENLVNEAALWATRNNKTEVDQDDFEFAHAKVIMGLAREETISEANKRKTAYHEAGHTLIDWFSPTNTKVHKVTIVPRGRSLGATYILPEEDQLNVNETEIKAKLAEYLAGRAAEQLVYGQTSTGAENDLKEATQLARRMVVHWGMSERLGPIAFRAAESNPFLGREMAELREYSDATARLIDEEVVRILREAEGESNRILNEKRDLLEKLTDALVEEEELDQERLVEILGPAAEREEQA